MGGEAIFKVETTYRGSEADYQRSYFAGNSTEQVLKNYITYYGNVYPDIEKFEDLETEDDRDANIFKTKESYKIPTFWKPLEGGDGKIFCEFYPITLESYFNVTKSANRTAPYRLSFPIDYAHEITVQLPENFNIPEEQESLKSDYYEYSHTVTAGDKVFSIHTSYKTKANHIPIKAFSKFVVDHSKMMSNLSYSLSYDKTLISKATSKTPGVVVSLLGLAIGVVLVIWLYHNYDPSAHYPPARGTPIGGWLILVGIGLSITPLRLIFDFVTNDYLLSGQGWLSYWYNGDYGYFLILLAEHLYNVVFLLYSALVLVLFFQRRSSVPKLVIIFYGVSCLVTVGDSILAYQLDPSAEVDSKEVTRAIIAAAIWIPYFIKSQRVKKTFVVVLNNNDDPIPGKSTVEILQ